MNKKMSYLCTAGQNVACPSERSGKIVVPAGSAACRVCRGPGAWVGCGPRLGVRRGATRWRDQVSSSPFPTVVLPLAHDSPCYWSLLACGCRPWRRTDRDWGVAVMVGMTGPDLLVLQVPRRQQDSWPYFEHFWWLV